VEAELVPQVWDLCVQAARANIPLTIDAEEVDRLELSLNLLEALLQKVAEHYPQWHGLGLAVQAYQTRSLEVVQHVISLARQYGVRLMCRLVKGAYWDAEVKRTQELGLPHYPVFTHKHHTDIAYLACAHALLAAPDVIYPQFATHNAATIAAILQMAERTGGVFELQRLHGMGEGIYREVLKNPLIFCRVYAPVGAHKDLLAYLVRRLLENGANASFVHQLADDTLDVSELLASPLHLAPNPSLALPQDMFGQQRINSAGVDLSVETMRAPLLAAYQEAAIKPVLECDIRTIQILFSQSATAFEQWGTTSVEVRANILRHAADTLQNRMPYFCALLVKEAFKTWGDAVAEVREAIDFLRYYAQQAELVMQPLTLQGATGENNQLQLQPRGTWVCISPWNFPLAIFMGQVAAALVTGNCVIAKPAEQTPFVAQEAVRLLHAAGIPTYALQMAHGAGDTVGAALVAHPDVAGVAFTGSTQVAKMINRALAAKDGSIVPLIAETGGINAMLVDSSALPEQVCDTVLQSAFRSAGQRCSALRLLCVHAQIADTVIAMVQGAARELVCGDPADFGTDVGPVIDADAYASIQKHLQRLYTEALPLLHPAEFHTRPNPAIPNLIAPAAFEIKAISDLTTEIFGPVLHIVRWQGDAHDVLRHINALGYGLTLGIHTRIDSRAHSLAGKALVGNVYINRNQVGAVVGVQPFGGQGLSGTGPKAGGPHYLQRFCTEQTVTINTTAAGGNAALLAG
jgi:RHH-type proline utilization regulon transcriptional repressor/proline dehydrogenase/delta 1-pyrroline-5-carboxylate dehydrogenase